MFWSQQMKTTLDVDDATLPAAKETTADRGTTIGLEGATIRNGAPLMPRRPEGSPPITMEIVNLSRRAVNLSFSAS
jgi:hypothetical protein